MPHPTEVFSEPTADTVTRCDADPEDPLSEQLIVAAEPRPETHAVVIGHRTLPLVLALMHRGCAAVTGLRLGARSPDAEPADLAWIADPATDAELDEAMDVACHRLSPWGRVVLDATVLVRTAGLWSVRRRIAACGLRIASIVEAGGHVLLVVMRAPVMARAA